MWEVAIDDIEGVANEFVRRTLLRLDVRTESTSKILRIPTDLWRGRPILVKDKALYETSKLFFLSGN